MDSCTLMANDAICQVCQMPWSLSRCQDLSRWDDHCHIITSDISDFSFIGCRHFQVSLQNGVRMTGMGLGRWGKVDVLFRLRIRRLSQLLAVSSQKLRAVAVRRCDAFDLRLIGSDELTSFMSIFDHTQMCIWELRKRALKGVPFA